MGRGALLALLLALGASQPAQAVARSVSSSLWVVSGDRVLVRYIVPREALQRMVPPGWPSPDLNVVSRYLLTHLSVSSARGNCPPIDQGYDIGLVDPLAVGPELYGYEILFRCPQPGGLILYNGALFEASPHHLDFSRMRVNEGDFSSQLFTAYRQRIAIPDSTSPPAVPALDYLRAGWVHVWSSVDQLILLFALALVLGWRRDADLAFALGALALGYLAGAFAGSRSLNLQQPAAAAWIGFIVALCAAELARRSSERRSSAAVIFTVLLLLASFGFVVPHWNRLPLLIGAILIAAGVLSSSHDKALPLWYGLTAGFGFLDGLELPSDWTRVNVAGSAPFAYIAAYGGGALLGSAVVLALTGWLRRVSKRSGFSLAQPFARTAIATALAGLGLFWFLRRLAV